MNGREFRDLLLAVVVLFSGTVGGAQSADAYLQLLRLYQDQPALAAQTAAKAGGDFLSRPKLCYPLKLSAAHSASRDTLKADR